LRVEREFREAEVAPEILVSNRAAPDASPGGGNRVRDVIPSDRRVRNRLLAALPAEEFALVQRELELVRLDQRQSLLEPGQPIVSVFFPETAVVSLVNQMENGSVVEIATAGCEGMVGLCAFLADDTPTVRAFAQIPGIAWRMSVDALARLARTSSAFHRLLLRYTQAFLTQVAQTAACNGTHLVEERCARWLLMTHDRVADDEFPLTQEFLAFMLGVRRAGVNVAMRSLYDAGLVRYSRGSVRIVDRAGLEEASCECYRVVRAHTARLLPERPGE
jgi:CRP-like cAMP-binding protein